MICLRKTNPAVISIYFLSFCNSKSSFLMLPFFTDIYKHTATVKRCCEDLLVNYFHLPPTICLFISYLYKICCSYLFLTYEINFRVLVHSILLLIFFVILNAVKPNRPHPPFTAI